MNITLHHFILLVFVLVLIGALIGWATARQAHDLEAKAAADVRAEYDQFKAHVRNEFALVNQQLSRLFGHVLAVKVAVVPPAPIAKAAAPQVVPPKPAA